MKRTLIATIALFAFASASHNTTADEDTTAILMRQAHARFNDMMFLADNSTETSDAPAEESSSTDTTPAEESSSSDTTPAEESSSSDTTPAEESSSTNTTTADDSSKSSETT
jgi:hypothetical protein